MIIKFSTFFQFIVDEFKTTQTFENKINEFVEANMRILKQEVKNFLKQPKPQEDERTVESIYSGMAGIALLYNFYASKTKNKNKTKEVCLVINNCFNKILNKIL